MESMAIAVEKAVVTNPVPFDRPSLLLFSSLSGRPFEPFHMSRILFELFSSSSHLQILPLPVYLTLLPVVIGVGITSCNQIRFRYGYRVGFPSSALPSTVEICEEHLTQGMIITFLAQTAPSSGSNT